MHLAYGKKKSVVPKKVPVTATTRSRVKGTQLTAYISLAFSFVLHIIHRCKCTIPAI